MRGRVCMFVWNVRACVRVRACERAYVFACVRACVSLSLCVCVCVCVWSVRARPRVYEAWKMRVEGEWAAEL